MRRPYGIGGRWAVTRGGPYVICDLLVVVCVEAGWCYLFGAGPHPFQAGTGTDGHGRGWGGAGEEGDDGDGL
jgi:hypothetical protein